MSLCGRIFLNESLYLALWAQWMWVGSQKAPSKICIIVNEDSLVAPGDEQKTLISFILLWALWFLHLELGHGVSTSCTRILSDGFAWTVLPRRNSPSVNSCEQLCPGIACVSGNSCGDSKYLNWFHILPKAEPAMWAHGFRCVQLAGPTRRGALLEEGTHTLFFNEQLDCWSKHLSALH